MNIRIIRDALIDAVKIDREMHEHIGPRPLQAQRLAYGHDFVDMAGWGKVPGDRDCQLVQEDADPHRAMRVDFWDQFDRAPSAAEISRADAVHEWLGFVDLEVDRRALLGWLKSKVGGKTFKRWCLQVEGVSTTTGTKRKNRALDKISAELARREGLSGQIGELGVLSDAPEISDVSSTIATAADDIEGLNNWASADARPTVTVQFQSDRTGDRTIEVPRSEFSWAQKRNERRRRQRAKKQKRAEGAT